MTVIGTSEIDVRARTTGFTSDVEKGVGGVGSKVSAVAGSIQGKLLGALGVGAVIKGIGTIGIAYQDSLNTFSAVADKAQLEAAGGLKAVGDAAIKLGNDLQLPNTSAADAASAMTELAKAGLSVKDTMAAAKGTLQLATAASVDEAQAATISANALNTFHLAGTQAAHVANVLANAANVSSGEVTDFAQGLAQGGLAAKNAGLSIDETAGALALFANNGLRGSDAGTSLKTMLSRLVPQSNTAKKAMDGLGLSFVNAHGKFLPLDQIAQQLRDHMGNLTQAERAHQMQLIFGSDAVRAATLLYGAGAKGVDHYTEAVDKAGGVQAIAAAKAQGLGGALRGFQSQAETLALIVFNDVAPSLEELVKDASGLMPIVTNLAHVAGQVLGPALGLVGSALSDVAGVVSSVAGFFADNKAAASGLAIVLTAALIPAATRAASVLAWRGLEAASGVILNMVGAVGRLRTGLAATTASATTLGGKMRALGASSIVGRIGIAALALVAFNAFQDFREGNRVINDLNKALSKPISTDALSSLAAAQNAVTDAFDKANHSGESFFGGMADWVTHPVQTFNDAMGNTADGVKATQAQVDAAYGAFHDLVLELHKWPTPEAQQQTSMVIAAMGLDVQDLATNDFPGLVAKVHEWMAANKASHNPTTQAREDITKLGSGAQSAADDVKALTSALDLLAGDALSADQASIAFHNDIDALDKALKKSHGSLSMNTKAARDARDAFDSAAQQAISVAEAEAKLKGGTDRARATLQEEIKTLREHGGNSDYAKAAINRLHDALAEIPGAAQGATNGLKHVSSQSHEVGKQAGENYATGFIGGLNSWVDDVVGAVESMVSQAAAAAKHKQKSGSPSKVTRVIGQEFGQGYVLGIEDLVPDAIVAATKMAASMAGALAVGLSKGDVRGAIRRSLRTDIESAERERDKAVAQLHRARDNRADARDELAKQTDIYKPLRASANEAARAVRHLQNEINAEEHSAHPNEKRLRALRAEQDAAERTARSTARMADHAQKAYDKASERAQKFADKVEESSKRVRQAQRALADAFRQQQVDQASAVLDTLSAEVDALVAKANGLTDSFKSAVLAGTDLQSVLSGLTTTTTDAEGNSVTTTADPVTSYLTTLQTTLTDSTALANDIGTLVGMGLNDSTIAEIVKLGPAAGSAFAEALIAAGPDAIAQINTLVAGIGDVAEHGMDAVAKQLYGPGAEVLGSLIAGIRSEFPELDATIDEINAKLATIGGSGGSAAVAAATTSASSQSAALAAKAGQLTIAPTTTVVVQGNADADTIAQLKTWGTAHNAELVRLAQSGVK